MQLDPHKDFDTRIWDEHWSYRYQETKEEIQRKITEMLRKAKRK